MKSDNIDGQKRTRITLNNHSLIAIIIAFLLIMPTVTIVVKADDIIVDDDGSGPYTTIQSAINAASPGDTIWVEDGSYNEALTINKANLRILSVNGYEPKIYVSSYSPGIDIQASNVIFGSGSTGENGFKIYGNIEASGGPTFRISSGADEAVIRDNTILAISGEIGNTALLVESGSEGIEFTGNTVTDFDQGISLQDGSNCIISSDNTFNHVTHPIYHGATISGTFTYYGTIQDAIDESPIDETVSVVSGNFTENLQINKSISLLGANEDENPTDGVRDQETIINGQTLSPIRIVQETENVTIKGFTFTIPNKSTSSNEAGVLIGPGTHNIIIENNIFKNITDGSGADTTSDESYAVMIYGRNDVIGGQSNIEVVNNVIENVEEYGIAINDNTSFVTISGNIIKNLIGSDHSTEGYPPWDPSWPTMVCSAVHLGGQVGPIHNVTIKNNILTTFVTGDGITTFAGSGISFAGVDEWLAPNRAWQGFNDIYISQNRITNNSMGITILTGNTSSNGKITVHSETINDLGNNLSANTVYGINNMAGNDTIIDASFNWWGDITGPYQAIENPDGLGIEVTENVTFWPWFEFGSSNNGYSIPPTIDYDVGLPNVDVSGYTIVTEDTEIEIDAEDDESGIYSLTYRVWNSTHRWGPWMNYTDSFTFTGQGEHRVQYNATDNAGTSLYTDETTSFSEVIYEEYLVDSVSPDAKILDPNGGELESGLIDIEWITADKLFDQGQLTWNDTISLTEDYPGHVQSFVPTQDVINSVQLLLHGDDANISVKIFDSLNPVPNVIAQSVKHVEDVGFVDNPEWVDFAFSSSISLDTSQTYYIGVTQEIYGDTGFKWYYFDDGSPLVDKYPFGHAWIKQTDILSNQSTMDFAFKTMYWNTDIDITVQYSNTGLAPWSTIAEGEDNDGLFTWDTATYGIPDGENYRVRIEAIDAIGNIGFDRSDETFIINNDEGPGVFNINITDVTIDSSEYTKTGDSLEISAMIGGDPETITADLSGFGKGTEVEYTSFTGGIARWTVTDILCVPSDGPVTVMITAEDATGESSTNTGSITADNTPPTLSIIKPRSGFYFMDGMRLLPFSYPFILGQITFEINAEDDGSGVQHVDFYLENELEATVTEAPYHWTWDRAATGFFDAEIVLVDNVGHEVFEEINDMFIINLDIVGHD